MKKEWLLIIVSVSLTFIIAFVLVRWFAPQLIGLPVDLQMVRVAKEVPPFFDGVFRPEDYESQDYISHTDAKVSLMDKVYQVVKKLFLPLTGLAESISIMLLLKLI